jgi:hypothetical protein
MGNIKNKKEEKYAIIGYYDERYPNNWIDKDISIEIKDYLEKELSAHIKNACELRKWLTDKINSGYEKIDSILIFCQDIVPDTVYDLENPNALLRKYLDTGGNIIWMGDVPFCYIGYQEFKRKLNRKTRKWENKEYKYFNPILNILGIFQTSINSPKNPIQYCNRQYKLNHKWYGLRPVSKDRDRTKKFISIAITESNYLFVPNYYESKVFLINPNDKGNVNLSVGSYGFSVSKETWFQIKRLKKEIMLFLFPLYFILQYFRNNFIYIKSKIITVFDPFVDQFFRSIKNIVGKKFFFILEPISYLLIFLIMCNHIKNKYIYKNNKYYSAWIKFFSNEGKFVRIWDYHISEFNKDMKCDLKTIINMISDNK